MQITEKLRKDILFALPELSIKQAEKIATGTSVSVATVWRAWRRLRSEKSINESPVILAIAELALKKKRVVVARHKRLTAVEKQLSEIK